MALAAIPFGLAIGLAVGMLGGGGSVLAVPVLVYILGQSAHQATTASLVIVTGGAFAGGLGHARRGRICWHHAGAFTAAALPSIIAGTALADDVSGSTLIAAFAMIMLAAAAATWRKAGSEREDDSSHPSTCPPLRVGRDLAAGLLVGAMTGFFGVGGGFLIAPALGILLTFSMRLAIGTSLAIITMTSVVGLAAHLLANRELNIAVTVTMTAACIAGALAGAKLAGHVPQRRLRRGFAGLVVAVAGYLVISAAFFGGPPGS